MAVPVPITGGQVLFTGNGGKQAGEHVAFGSRNRLRQANEITSDTTSVMGSG